METLAQKADRLQAERFKEAKGRSGARMGRAVGSPEVAGRVMDTYLHLSPGGREEKPAAPKIEPRRETTTRIKDPTQFRMTPPGFGMGTGPNVKADMANTITSRQAHLNHLDQQEKQFQEIEAQLFGQSGPPKGAGMDRQETARTEGFMNKTHAEQAHALYSRETAAREGRPPEIADRGSIGKRLIETVMLNRDHAERSREDDERGR